MRHATLTAALVPLAALAWAQVPTLPVAKRLESRDWKAVVSLPPGAEYALLSEDPGTHGVEALVQFPSGYEVPEHFHEHEERILVLKGRLWIGSPGHTVRLGPGDMLTLPAGTRHTMKTGFFRGTVFHVKTDKPFDYHAGTDGR